MIKGGGGGVLAPPVSKSYLRPWGGGGVLIAIVDGGVLIAIVDGGENHDPNQAGRALLSNQAVAQHQGGESLDPQVD